jgi:arylsulfatase A-like enzyme
MTIRMRVGLTVAAACAALASGVLLTRCSARGPKRKNVILITLDTTRADYLSCYGVHPGITPNLDAIAAEGTRFDMAISTAGVTPVSHAAILTGLNNQEHKLRVLAAEGGFRLPDNVPTLGTILEKAGYHTVAVHSALPVSRHFGFKRGFDVFEDLDGELTQSTDGTKVQWEVPKYQRRSDTTTELVEKSLGTEQPFFLWIHYWDPHDWTPAFLPPPEFMPPHDELFDPQGEPIRPGTAIYSAELHYEDIQIGKLFDWLKQSGLYENTIVVITADHGQGLMEHDWAAHRLLYQEQVHVPMLVRIPGEQQRKSVTDLVRTIDIAPTILDYAGVAPPPRQSGRSLRALIEGKPDEKRVAFGDQINGYDTNAGMAGKRPLDRFLYMAIDWPWKLIYRPLTPEQSLLYKLDDDPHEKTNLFATNRADAVRLLKHLARARPWVRGEFEKVAATDDGNVQKGLEGLGYLGGDTVNPQWIWVCPEHPEQRMENWDARCPICKEPPVMRVDPACYWACEDHPDQKVDGPDQKCPAQVLDEHGVPSACAKLPILMSPKK